MPAVMAEHSGPLTAIGKHQPGTAGPTPADGFAADGGGLLFKQVTPRRRQDQFGRDNTRHADYLLSMAVFPTGVRAPLLSDLQKKTEHQCGFEVIDKGTTTERTGGRHVHIQDSKGASRHGSAADSAKKPPPNTPLTASLKLSDRGHPHHHPHHPHHHLSQSISVAPSSARHSLSTEMLCCCREKENTDNAERRWAHSSTEVTKSSTVGVGEKKMKDIRDPLYLNTYCPEERKLRYKKTTLPRVTNRSRPWTVSESNPAYRFVSQSQETPHSYAMVKGKAGRPPWLPHNFRIHARDVMARVNGRPSAFDDDGDDDDDEEDDSEETESSSSGKQALLEVKSYFAGNGDVVLGDQRDSLRGKQGCLHAKVKQCIKFVKYREKLARSLSVERPLKAEGGRYRPFSTTTIRTPRNAPSSSPGPRHPDPTSVEIYKEYIDTIALQTRLVSAADKRRKPRAAVSGVPRNNTAASSYQDSAVQSVSDSNRPPTSRTNLTDKASRVSDNPGAQQGAEKDGERGKDPSSGGGGSDPRGVHHALDIIRLSPKAQPPRSSRTSRTGRSTHRGEGEAEEEGGKGAEGAEQEGKGKTHAIFLPNVSKSATTSVCSFVEESVNAAET